MDLSQLKELSRHFCTRSEISAKIKTSTTSLTLKGPTSCRAKTLSLVGKRHFVKKSIFVSSREMENIVFLKKVKNYPKWGRGGIWLQRKNVFFDFFFSKKICGRKIRNHKSIYEKEKVDFCDLAHQYNKI